MTHLVALTLLSLALAAGAWLGVPYSTPLTADYLRLLDDLVAGRPVPYTPYSLGHSLLVAQAIRIGGHDGLYLLNAAVYVATVLLAYAALRSLGLSLAALVGAAAVACYPHYVLNVKRLMNTGFVALLLVTFALFLARVRRGPPTLLRAVAGGLLFGIMLLDRPNLIVLAPLAALVALRGRGSWTRAVVWLMLSVGIAVVALAAAIVPFKGRLVVFDPYYAAYTFANGAHRYAFEGILRDYNGEPAMPRALAEKGIAYTRLAEVVPEMTDVYLRLGREYILENPLRYAALTGLKLVNLFRPDFRNLGSRSLVPVPVFVVMQLAISAIFVVWVIVRWRCRGLVAPADGVLALPMLWLYVLPFVLTNSDTRYRIPFDAILLVDLAYCWAVSSRSELRSRDPEGSLRRLRRHHPG